jgi:hypothetical protein
VALDVGPLGVVAVLLVGPDRTSDSSCRRTRTRGRAFRVLGLGGWLLVSNDHAPLPSPTRSHEDRRAAAPDRSRLSVPACIVAPARSAPAGLARQLASKALASDRRVAVLFTLLGAPQRDRERRFRLLN